MQLRSLSATAANVYLLCPKRYETEKLNGEGGRVGVAANLGSACHEVAQVWVEDGHYQAGWPSPEAVLRELWEKVYWKHLADASRYDEGWKMMETWLARQEWKGREVLSTEQKKSFSLRTSIGDVPFNYIMDRVDRLDNGDIEVIDYKTLSWNVTPDDLKTRLQARAYAAAAHLEYPEARRIWVTFDMFRFEPSGIVFSAAECDATLAYLHDIAEQVIADTEPVERLNNECRFCPRKHVCARVAEFVRSTGDLLVGDIEATVAARDELELARKAIVARLAELDESILEWLRVAGEGDEKRQVGRYTVMATQSRRRVVDIPALAEVLSYDDFLDLAPSVSVKALDDLLKSGAISAESASRIRQAVTWKAGATGVSVRPMTVEQR